ncbi:hypothetical protein SAMN05444972_12016 [Marininema halotolerans]|uniref:Uncharacterized protein n=1 Tax=Marininema halotolerans TaxID=1155944 RepID=A0A1I6UT89_9BACL|nr:hypothetical protein SAMN05444972_12016 [Marininema halotolerans]
MSVRDCRSESKDVSCQPQVVFCESPRDNKGRVLLKQGEFIRVQCFVTSCVIVETIVFNHSQSFYRGSLLLQPGEFVNFAKE